MSIVGISCKEEGRVDFIDDNAPAPGQVTNVTVENRAGGAVLKYMLPIDKNLLYVRAEYEIKPGMIRETKSSYFKDSLVIEGFGTPGIYDVKLYSVGKNEKESAPYIAQINPTLPPVQLATKKFRDTFGGVAIDFENPEEASLAIVLMADTANSAKWADLQTFHTKSEAMKFSRRGLEAKPAQFGAYLRDRWGNVSDTIFKTLTPIEEIKLPKDNFKNAALPTDYFAPAEGNFGYRLEQLWLGGEAANNEFYASTHSGPMPVWFTINLGGKMSISRMQKWPRAGYELYSGTAPRVFEVWGSDNPNPNGSWDDSWHLLGVFEQFKPSGYGEGREVGPITDEDNDYWYNRTEFELVPTELAPNPYQTVTHLRFKILSTFGTYGTDATMSQIINAELTFWGQVKD